MHWLDFNLVDFLIAATQGQVNNASSSISTNSSFDIQILLQQIKFLQDANDKLANSFDSYVKAADSSFRFYLTLLSIIGGFIAAINIWFERRIDNKYKQTVKEIKEITNNKIDYFQQEALQQISIITKRKIEDIQKTINRESVIRKTNILYFHTYQEQPKEYQLLKDRGFIKISPTSDLNNLEIKNTILVLDFVNSKSNDIEKDVDSLLNNLEANSFVNSILIIYFVGHSERINQLKESKKIDYYTATNNRITLVGAAVDSAYILDSIL